MNPTDSQSPGNRGVKMPKRSYSVIIPTLDEEYSIGRTIEAAMKSMPGAEIIIADGGSTDRTLEICLRENVRVVRSKRGRGIQLHEGAKAAGGELLCFLHADTYLPDNARKLLDDFFDDDRNKICRFRLGYDIEHRLLNNYSKLSRFDFPFTRFGDMGITVRKEFYFAIGGFRDWNFMEDVDFLRKASSKSKVRVLPAYVTSSARAYLKYGFARKQLVNALMLTKYFMGFRKYIERNEYYTRKVKTRRASIIVFVRYPTEGKVKTRLAAALGNRAAKEVYGIVSKRVLSEVIRIGKAYRYAFYSDLNEKEQIREWLGGKFLLAHQEGKLLGERMLNAFIKVFSHGAKKAVIIGSDIPDLTGKLIEETIAKLDGCDVVIGPAKDGGYYLLGMKTIYPSLFEGIEFGTSTVLSQTCAALDRLGLRYSMLRELHDIDTEEDLVDWLNMGKASSIKKKVISLYDPKSGEVEKECAQ